MRENVCSLKVRYDEVGVYDMAHHSNFIKWFDVALSALLEEVGLNLKWLEDKQIYVPMYEINCKYHMPVYKDDVLTIKTTVAEMGPVKIVLRYRFYKGEALVAEATGAHIFVKSSMRPISMKKVMPDLYESFKRYLEQ
ncbi:MAG: acyl-CoA thioesterase [Christensenellales bacterium]